MTIKLRFILLVLAISCPTARSKQIDSSFSLSDLKSPEWQMRSDAYSQIAKNAEALQRPEVKAALFDLLDRENQILRKEATNSNDYAESYGEYVSYLADTAAQVADWGNQRQACVLAHGPYDPISQFASDLAVKGGLTVIPCLLKMSKGSFGDRYQSIPVLVHCMALRADLSPETHPQVQRAVMSGMSDSNVLIRQATIEAVGAYGNKDMIPVLEELASSDPVSRRLDNGRRYFTVRETAKAAIRSIQERTNDKPSHN